MTTYQINGFFDVNANIVSNIANINTITDSQKALIFSDISSQLDKLKTAYTTLDANIAPILSHQYNVVQLLENEKQYLQNESANIDNYASTQQRQLEINTNSQKRSQYFSYILMVLIVVLICYLIIAFIVPYPFYLPLVFLLFLGGGVYIVYLLYLFYKRDPSDFDKLRQ
jgi:hypothetical protein